MAIKTPSELLDNIPTPAQVQWSQSPQGLGLVHEATLRDLCVRASSGVLPHSDTALLAEAATEDLTIAAYYIKHSAGAVKVAGVYGRFDAADDQDLLADDIVSIGLDGESASALSADGKSCKVALVAVVINGAVALRAVFGDEADDGSEEAVTAAQIKAALLAEDADNLEVHGAVVLSRFKVKRAATDTITMTHTDPASDDSLAAERAGTVNPFGVS